MKTLRCIAIDDEPKALDLIELYCKKVNFIDLVDTFRDSIKALEFLQDNSVDLIFLDINMPDLNGMDFLKALDKIPMVIFATAYSEYAVESYDFETVDYLLKPISFARFTKAVNRVAARAKPEMEGKVLSKKEYMIVKSGNEQIKVELSKILYFEGAQNYIYIHTTSSNRIMTLMRMKEIDKELQGHDFIRIHKSYIVSFHYIDKIESYQVLIGGVNIPVGSTYREVFKREVEKRRILNS